VFRQAVESGTQAYLCAVCGERLIGFASLTLKNNLWMQGWLAHVDELVVDRAFRGRGLGTRLLEQLGVIARQKGCRRIELDSAFHRKRAHRFYERLGFANRACLFSKAL
jgi:GNAT superfamily N-acetyltransferase